MSKTQQLGEIIDSISVTHKFNKDELIFLNTSDVLEGKILTNVYSKVDSLKGQAKKTIQNGDILFSEIRPKNKRYAFVNVVNPEDYVVSTKLMVLRNKSKNVITDYLYYFLTYEGTLDYLQMRAENRIGSFPQITFDIVKVLGLNVPDISTQQKIASVLSALDAKIELNNRINAQLEAIAKTLYDYWFVQFDFPDENGKPYKSSGGKMQWNEELKRKIPDRWKVSNLNDIVELVKGNVSPSEIKTNTPYIGLEHIGRKTIVLSNWANSESANSDKTAFKKHDILFGKIRPYFHKVAVAIFDGITSTDTIILRPKKNIYFGLALQTVFTDIFVEIATQSSTGSKMPRADWNFLQNHKLPIPKSELLETYQNIFESALNKIEISVIENQQLFTLRDWLLPMLMNGQVKVG